MLILSILTLVESHLYGFKSSIPLKSSQFFTVRIANYSAYCKSDSRFCDNHNRTFRDYEEVSPPSSFIHVSDFPSPSSLASHLVHLASDEDAFARYLWWTEHYDVIVLNR